MKHRSLTQVRCARGVVFQRLVVPCALPCSQNSLSLMPRWTSALSLLIPLRLALHSCDSLDKHLLGVGGLLRATAAEDWTASGKLRRLRLRASSVPRLHASIACARGGRKGYSKDGDIGRMSLRL